MRFYIVDLDDGTTFITFLDDEKERVLGGILVKSKKLGAKLTLKDTLMISNVDDTLPDKLLCFAKRLAH